MKHWFMRDRQDRNQHRYYWVSVSYNDADYHDKHFCSAHGREKRPIYLTPRHTLDALRALLGKAPHIF